MTPDFTPGRAGAGHPEPEKAGHWRGVTGPGHPFLGGHRAQGGPSFGDSASGAAPGLTCWAAEAAGPPPTAAAPGPRRPAGRAEPSAPPSCPLRMAGGGPGGSAARAPP